jgi:hypothetical protein
MVTVVTFAHRSEFVVGELSACLPNHGALEECRTRTRCPDRNGNDYPHRAEQDEYRRRRNQVD